MNLTEKNKKAATQMILLFLVIQLLSGIIPAFFPESVGPQAFLLVPMILFTVGAFGMIWIERKKEMYYAFEKNFSDQLSKIIIWGIAGIFIAIFAQNIATFIEVTFLGSSIESENTQFLVEIIRSYPLFLILVGVTGPIMEEFVFRKAIFGILIEKIGGIGAAVVSSLIFAIIHFDGLLLVYSTMGFVFSWLYYKTKNIWTPIIAHSLMNIIAVLANLYL